MLLKWLNLEEAKEEIPIGLYKILPKKKHAQIKKYRTETLRKMHYQAWQTLVEMLIKMGFSKIDVTKIKINKFGKPYDPRNRFFFSISYSYPYVLIAVSESELGVDIEKHNNLTIDEMELFLHLDELTELGPNPSQSELYDVWTKKEAILKLIGTGFQVSPDSINTISSDLSYVYRSITTEKLTLPFIEVSVYIAQYR